MKKLNITKIKFIADECSSDVAVVFLRSLGYAVESVWDLGLHGATNGTLIERATKDQKIFITEDQDFCNILIYPPRLYHGVIVLKSSPKVEPVILTVLRDLLSQLSPEEFDKSLVIVDRNKYRIKKE